MYFFAGINVCIGDFLCQKYRIKVHEISFEHNKNLQSQQLISVRKPSKKHTYIHQEGLYQNGEFHDHRDRGSDSAGPNLTGSVYV